jgi:hypothetical protein
MITEDDKQRIRTHDLNDNIVRTMLSGYLHQELRNIHGIYLTPNALHRALDAYVRNVERALDEAVAMQRMGFRPRNW